MTNTVQKSISAATARVKAAVSAVDAKFAVIATPPIVSKSTTPGQILALMAQTGCRTPDAKSLFKSVGAIKRELYAEHSKAQKQLDDAKVRCNEFMDAAQFIKTGAPMIAVSDPLVRMMAESARKGVLSGAVPPTFGDELQAIGLNGLMRLKEASDKLEVIKSAGRVAYSKQYAKALAVLSEHDGYNEHDRRLFKSVKYRAQASFELRRIKHRVGFFKGTV